MTDGTGIRASTPFGDFLRDVAEDHNATLSRVPSDPVPREKWPRLLNPVTPMRGESLRGLVYRSCAVNGLPNSWGLLKTLGLEYRSVVSVSEHPYLAVAELAHAMRVPDAAVERRRYAALDTTRVDFHGLRLSNQAIEIRYRCFSPTAFRQDAERAANTARSLDPADRFVPHHRTIWEMRDIPFCLDQWDMLQTTCPCEAKGVVQRWTRTPSRIDECDRCGDPLHTTVEAIPVPDDMRPGLSVLRAIAHSDSAVREAHVDLLPRALQQVDRTRLFALIVRLARNIDPNARTRPIDDPRGRLHGLWQACNALTEWTPEVPALIRNLKATSNTTCLVRRQWFQLGSPIAPSDEALPLNISSLVGIRTGAAISKLSDETLQLLHAQGALTQHFHLFDGSRHPAFDPGEVKAFGEAWHARVEPQSFAREIGIATHGIEQLAALGIVTADAPALAGTGPYFTARAIDAFFDGLENRAVDVTHIADPVTLVAAMRHVRGRPKPWGPVFGLLLDGRIPFSIVEGSRASECIVLPSRMIPAVVAATFDRADFPDAVFAERIPQRDALEQFNIGQNSGHILASLERRGKIPVTYAVAEVDALAQEFTSLSELADVIGMSPSKAYFHLQSLGYSEERKGLWKRSLIQELA